MALFNSRKPKRSDRVWWEVLKLEAGKKWRGWKAGAVVGVDTHFCGASRPCHAAFTDGVLACPMCAAELPVVFKVYVPLWSEDGSRRVLIMGDRNYDAAERVAHLKPVMVTMGTGRGNPYYCGSSQWTTANPPIGMAEMTPQDITPHLLTMWQDRVIREWVAAHPVGSDNAVSLAPLPPVADPVPPRAARAGRDAPPRAEADMPAAGEALTGAIARLRARAKGVTPEPSANGVHKKTIPPKG